MKILLMNDFLLCGGAEIYTENLANLLKNNGHDVYIITFDKEFESKMAEKKSRRLLSDFDSELLNKNFFEKSEK